MIWQTLGPNLPQSRNPITRTIGRSVFALMGWQIEGDFPDRSKMVVALAPHSSNVDFILTVAVLWGLGLKASYLMKHSLFWFPLGALLTALGGLPVNRTAAHGMVGELAEQFARRTRLVLGITPEGTRRGVREWRLGFARIAQAAGVPVLPAILNYETRIVRFAPLIEEVSDVDAVLSRVQSEAARGVPRC